MLFFFFFSSRRRHTRWPRDWSSDVCSSDLRGVARRARPPWRRRTARPPRSPGRPPHRSPPGGPGRSPSRSRPWWPLRLPVPRSRDLLDELVDQFLLGRLVELLLHHPFGQLNRDLADLGRELAEHAVPFRPDLLGGSSHGGTGLLLRLGLKVGPQLLGRLAPLLDDPVRLLASVRQLLAVPGQFSLGLTPGRLGLLQISLDLVPAVFQDPVEPGDDPFGHERENDAEGDRSNDNLG